MYNKSMNQGRRERKLRKADENTKGHKKILMKIRSKAKAKWRKMWKTHQTAKQKTSYKWKVSKECPAFRSRLQGGFLKCLQDSMTPCDGFDEDLYWSCQVAFLSVSYLLLVFGGAGCSHHVERFFESVWSVWGGCRSMSRWKISAKLIKESYKPAQTRLWVASLAL